MVEITLPRLVGTRDAARELVEDAFRRAETSNEERIRLFARAVLSAAPSFVDELVASLARHGVSEIDVFGDSEDLLSKLDDAANRQEGSVRIVSGSRLTNA